MKFDFLTCRGLDQKKLGSHAKLFEKNGGDSMSFDEDYMYEDTFTRAGFVAGVTERISLYTMINPYTRHPALMAISGITLDRISGGRAKLVIGRSVEIWMKGWFGYDYSTPIRDLRDYMDLLRKLESGQTVNFANKHFTLRNVSLSMSPFRKHLPILIAAMGPKALRLASKIADGAVLNMYTSPRYAEWVARLVREERETAKDFELGCQIRIAVTENAKSAIRHAKREIALLLSVPRFGELLLDRSGFGLEILDPIRRALKVSERLQHNVDPLQMFDEVELARAASLIPDEIADALTVIGSVSRCRDRLAEYSKAGVDVASLFTSEAEFETVANNLRELRI